MRVSFIATVYNEESLIVPFLESIFRQTKLPDEIIIVDGGSTDNTVSEISKFQIPLNNKVGIRLIFKKGNRSVGRNEAIKNAQNEIIAISDAGNILENDWLENIVQPFSDKNVDVVAGYYKGLTKTTFQKCLVPYVLVMEDKIKKNEFLPATRSMAIRKSVWKKAGKFNEKLSHNEDYAFANKLKEIGAKIVFKKEAIVNWIPRKNLKDVFVMFFRFALGDAQANILRDKVLLIFARYILGIYLFLLCFIEKSVYLYGLLSTLVVSYLVWSIKKNYKYVKNLKAILYLPLMQIVADSAVILGTIVGLIQKIFLINYLKASIKKIFINNFVLIIILAAYVLVMLSVINFGIPNQSHPFTYHMDEWHFLQALKTFIKDGTGLRSGAANIPLYHIISSIIFILPFYFFHIVNPLAIKNTLDNLPMQHILFIILRLHTLFYGILTISCIYLIIKKYIKFKHGFFTLLFTFSPVWIFLSNYYKYDITLNFWITITILFIFKFGRSQRLIDYLLGGITCALALSTKFTAAPLLVGYVLSYFIFSKTKNLKHLFIAIFEVVLIFAIVGIPDFLIGKGSYFELINSTLVVGPNGGNNYNLNYPEWFYLVFVQYASLLGYFLFYIFGIGFIYWIINISKKRINMNDVSSKEQLFLYLTFIFFFCSIIGFNIEGGGNRMLVLLPFIVLTLPYFIRHITRACNINVYFIETILILGLSLNIFQTYAWQSVKLYVDARNTSSVWMETNIPKGSTIGLENIPIYQGLPDLVLKEFYEKQRNHDLQTRYSYVIVSEISPLPRYIIITNDFDNMNYLKSSSKKLLVERLYEDNYVKIATFTPNLFLYNLVADKITFLLVYPTPLTISFYEKY
jgi:glycosyltransferase involved in cell wall biosynthesis